SGLLGRPGFELHRLDLATAEVEPLLAGAAAVFHLAARPGVRASFGPGFSGYGPRQRPDMGFRRFIEAAMAGRPLVVYGDGGQTREFTYVDDVVRASLLALTAPVEMEAVNIGGGRRVSLDEALELIGEATGRRLTVERRPPLAGDARHTGADGTRAEALLGYRPETDLATGLAAQVAWVTERQRAATG
ncbi:MAG TPA: NAD-dependent epimerase/dehydratase family protein, partial [Actinomycetes bacterium]|nr:NAD-dependent epimerase/dehydratase family protein [Actinomycetes bacterium]